MWMVHFSARQLIYQEGSQASSCALSNMNEMHNVMLLVFKLVMERLMAIDMSTYQMQKIQYI